MIMYNVSLNGGQAGTSSSATGSAALVLDDIAQTLDVNLSFSGLLGTTTAAHIHCCAPPGVNAGIIIPFGSLFPLGVTSGTYMDMFSLTPVQVTDIKSGQSYINIHTTEFPGGEIRGQIAPEPATFALVAAALAALVFLRRRVAGQA